MNLLFIFIALLVGFSIGVIFLSICGVNRSIMFKEIYNEACARARQGDKRFTMILNEFHGKNNW